MNQYHGRCSNTAQYLTFNIHGMVIVLFFMEIWQELHRPSKNWIDSADSMNSWRPTMQMLPPCNDGFAHHPPHHHNWSDALTCRPTPNIPSSCLHWYNTNQDYPIFEGYSWRDKARGHERGQGMGTTIAPCPIHWCTCAIISPFLLFTCLICSKDCNPIVALQCGQAMCEKDYKRFTKHKVYSWTMMKILLWWIAAIVMLMDILME